MEKQSNGFEPDYDRLKDLKDFDDTKMGVKGLVDSGVKTLPKMFIRPTDELLQELNTPCVKREVPVIDLQGIGTKDCYDEIVQQILYASESWGFFQVVNHGVPLEVLDKVMERMRMFHEQDGDAKKEFYTRDYSKQFAYDSNFDLFKSRTANWRDTLAVNSMDSGALDPEQLPIMCGDIILEYVNHLRNLGETLLELLSVALGLEPDHLNEMGCNKKWSLINHYQPVCPAPELTLGTTKHTDPSFLTMVLQDQVGGLQVLNQNQWVDVRPIPGSFVVNIGDILQMISNDKFKSVHHRVTANSIGPRLSVAFFLKGNVSSTKLYGPIKELLSDENPPVYREFTLGEFHTNFLSRSLDDCKPVLEPFKLHHLGE